MPNRLTAETSPYLQQHADNPVDWYPWGEEALALARCENKPILLSVGYSACHWCHVMAHESFADETVAAVMNRLFVNIKVDREERPDLDQIYQAAYQMLAQRAGGWPLTMFLAPDGTPFFGGTYFPKQPRHQLPGFADLLEKVAAVWRDQRAGIEAQNGAILAGLARTLPDGGGHHSEFSATALSAAARQLAEQFDERWGGFGTAPKFPQPADLEFLMSRDDAESRDLALSTLARMAEGGIYDQLGGGFCRYSVDERWEIPHFEKMLYDNGPLLRLYADAWAITADHRYREVAEQTAAWVMREMQSPAGGYYSSLDADSAGEEGRFYVWSREEVAALLSAEEYAVAAPYWGLDGPPNFEATHWHLHVAGALDGGERLLAAAREKLFAARARRIRPARDEKILVSWNALMIAGMARAGRLCARPDWIASARQALAFIRHTLWREERLLATCKDGHAHLNAYLDDHAFLLDALLELLQAEYRAEDMAFAETLADALLERFEDREAGGFFFTSHDHERLILRPKPGHDNATPSGNGVAARALQRLAVLTGEPRYAAAAERTLALYQPQFSRQPGGFASLLMALDEWLQPPRLVILRGPAAALGAWQGELDTRAAPGTLVLALGNELAPLPPVLAKPLSDAVNAWVCEGVNCLPPIGDPETLLRLVSKPRKVQ